MENKLEIQKNKKEEVLELRVQGRIDSYWSEHLNTFLDEEIRAGNHHLVFNLDEVTFISSIGIRLFIRYSKQLIKINGSLRISSAADIVKTVFEMAGLIQLFNTAEPIISESKSTDSTTIETDSAHYTFSSLEKEAVMKLQLLGNPDQVKNSSFAPNQCTTVEFNAQKFGLGLGALGSTFDEYSSRIGEFIGIGNTVMHLPTDGTNKPDYLIRTGAFIPSINILYGMLVEGSFFEVVKFEKKPDNTLKLSEIVNTLLQSDPDNKLVIVMLAETSGLVGASINISPFTDDSGISIFNFPEIRNKINYTPEPSYNRMLSLSLGVVVHEPKGDIKEFLRPISKESTTYCHFHSAVFPYLAQKKNNVQLQESVAALFENSQLQNLLHLINDEREINGLGESEFIQGICWIGKFDTL